MRDPEDVVRAVVAYTVREVMVHPGAYKAVGLDPKQAREVARGETTVPGAMAGRILAGLGPGKGGRGAGSEVGVDGASIDESDRVMIGRANAMKLLKL